jgi:hypothetical protein
VDPEPEPELEQALPSEPTREQVRQAQRTQQVRQAQRTPERGIQGGAADGQVGRPREPTLEGMADDDDGGAAEEGEPPVGSDDGSGILVHTHSVLSPRVPGSMAQQPQQPPQPGGASPSVAPRLLAGDFLGAAGRSPRRRRSGGGGGGDDGATLVRTLSAVESMEARLHARHPASYAFLRRVRLFRGLSCEQLGAVAAAAQPRTFAVSEELHEASLASPPRAFIRSSKPTRPHTAVSARTAARLSAPWLGGG